MPSLNTEGQIAFFTRKISDGLLKLSDHHGDNIRHHIKRLMLTSQVIEGEIAARELASLDAAAEATCICEPSWCVDGVSGHAMRCPGYAAYYASPASSEILGGEHGN